MFNTFLSYHRFSGNDALMLIISPVYLYRKVIWDRLEWRIKKFIPPNKDFSPEEYRMAEKHLKKMFNILNHQGNVNQNNLEIPPHSSQNGQDQKLRWQQMLARMWRKRNTPPFWVGLQACTTTLEISLAVPQKIGHSTTGGSSNTSPGHISRRSPNW